MNQRGLAYITLIILVIVLAGTLWGSLTLVKKSIPTRNVQQTITPMPIPTTKTDIELARETLITYFDLLNKKLYSEAIKYHGSGYETLQGWNPTINKVNNSFLVMTPPVYVP